tara:strand:- start:60048 stop:60743 length:696 start_codon:yes stop_codon:yes gene_type:complete
MKNYITKSSEQIKKSFKRITIQNTPLHILKNLTNDIDLDFVAGKLNSVLPRSSMTNVDNIYVGSFEEFSHKDRQFNAMYKDGTIYVSNEQDNEEDLIDDIVHEVAHSLEKESDVELYNDISLETEFLAKRKLLYNVLPDDKKINLVYFLNPDYDASFDSYLHKKLGYNFLRSISNQIYYSPYAITALKEYWANGFENYLLGDKNKLKQLSPILYNKIKKFFDKREEENYGL